MKVAFFSLCIILLAAGADLSGYPNNHVNKRSDQTASEKLEKRNEVISLLSSSSEEDDQALNKLPPPQNQVPSKSPLRDLGEPQGALVPRKLDINAVPQNKNVQDEVHTSISSSSEEAEPSLFTISLTKPEYNDILRGWTFGELQREIAEILKVLKKKNKDETITLPNKDIIVVEKFEALIEGGELNDDIVNSYLKLLKVAHPNQDYKVISSYLRSPGRVYRDENLKVKNSLHPQLFKQNASAVLWPIHLPGHWALASFTFLDDKEIPVKADIYNSMANTPEAQDLIKQEVKKATGDHDVEAEFMECPKQTNYTDCGVFVLWYSEVLLGNRIIPTEPTFGFRPDFYRMLIAVRLLANATALNSNRSARRHN